MSQDESPQPDRSAGSRFSRDTLLLLGALAFLILAVTLTFLFTPNSDNQFGQVSPTAPTGTLASEGGMPTGQPPGGSYPEPSAFSTPGGMPTGQPLGGSYPEPSAFSTPGGGQPTSVAYPNPVGGTPTRDESSALRETPALVATGNSSAGAFVTVSPNPSSQSGFSLSSPTPEGKPYPEPDGTAPTQPTFNPAVFTATIPSLPFPTYPAGGQIPTSIPTIPQPPTFPPVETLPPPFLPTSPPFQPTNPPEAAKEPPPTPTDAPVLPTTPPVDVLEGTVRWSVGQSPIMVHRDVQLAPGAELIIEPGVEVRLDPGVSIYIDGARLLVLGLPNRRVRFVGNTRARWSGIFGRPNSFIVMENTDLRGGGAGGTVMAVDTSELIVRGGRFADNGGGILITDTKLEVRDTEIAGNDVPFGAALDASYARGTTVTLQNNRIGGNRLSDGAPMVRVANQSTFSSPILDISGNLIRGGAPNLQVTTNGPIQGHIACNVLVGDSLGFGLRTQTVQVNSNGESPISLAFVDNIIDEHVPPVIPIYLTYGLGRGSTSEVLIDMRNNWWGDTSGPYEPVANPLGRGDSVGSNILFSPWLTQPPACAPSR